MIILFSCSSSLLFTQGNETEKQLVSTPVKGELGVVLGTPAGANVIASTHFDSMLLKGSLGYFGSGNIGYQLELGYKFSELTNTYQAVSVGIGYFDHDTFEYSSFSYGKVRSANTHLLII